MLSGGCFPVFCIPTACFPSKWRQLSWWSQRQVDISCLTFSPCHIDWPSLMPVAWANVVPFCCVKNVALYCKQQFCSCPVVLSLTAASNTLSWLQQFLSSVLGWMGHYCRLWIQLALQIHPQTLLLSWHPQLNLSFFSVPFFFHHEYLLVSETSKGQFSIFLEPVCWNLYQSDVTKSILWEPRAELP